MLSDDDLIKQAYCFFRRMAIMFQEDNGRLDLKLSDIDLAYNDKNCCVMLVIIKVGMRMVFSKMFDPRFNNVPMFVLNGMFYRLLLGKE